MMVGSLWEIWPWDCKPSLLGPSHGIKSMCRNCLYTATSQLIAFPSNKASLHVSYMVLWCEGVVLCDYRSMPVFPIWLFFLFFLWVVLGILSLILGLFITAKATDHPARVTAPKQPTASAGIDLSGIEFFLCFSSPKFSLTSFSRSGMHRKWLFKFDRAF